MELEKESKLMVSQPRQPIGKSQLYTLLVDATGDPVLDVEGNKQVVALQSVDGKLQVTAILAASSVIAGKFGIDQTAGQNVVSFGAAAQPVSITGSLANIPVEIQACKPEVSSSQDSQIATTAKTYARAEGASQIEVYVESGYARVRTDGQPCTTLRALDLLGKLVQLVFSTCRNQ